MEQTQPIHDSKVFHYAYDGVNGAKKILFIDINCWLSLQRVNRKSYKIRIQLLTFLINRTIFQKQRFAVSTNIM